MRSTLATMGAIFVIFMAWIAVWGLSDMVTETLTHDERKRFYWGILLAVILVISFNPTLLHRF